MGLIASAIEKIISTMLKNFKDTISKNFMQGIGRISDIHYKDKALTISVILEGLEDHEITAKCSSIAIAEGGTSVTLDLFESNMPFLQTVLNRYVAGKPITIPEDSRNNAMLAKKYLKL